MVLCCFVLFCSSFFLFLRKWQCPVWKGYLFFLRLPRVYSCCYPWLCSDYGLDWLGIMYISRALPECLLTNTPYLPFSNSFYLSLCPVMCLALLLFFKNIIDHTLNAYSICAPSLLFYSLSHSVHGCVYFSSSASFTCLRFSALGRGGECMGGTVNEVAQEHQNSAKAQ